NRISQIEKDIQSRIPTSGDDFAMTVKGQHYCERKLAGAALMERIKALDEIRLPGETVIGSIGGFDIKFTGAFFRKVEFVYAISLARTGSHT
ncbi:hypothetical protein ABTD55_21040, partial [Acinetobacter baumannii]